MAREIKRLPTRKPSEEIGSEQGSLFVDKETEIQGIGMGVLNDGTPFLHQRGLAALCGVQNAHIGTISADWNEDIQKPRIAAIKDLLASRGVSVDSPHIECKRGGRTIYAYPDTVCLAILEYYAFEAGANTKEEAVQNFRTLAGQALRDFIYTQVGYDPTGQNRFDKWHERIALNYQSAPKGYFHVFNEAHSLIYELILAGAEIGEKFVVDISIGSHWSKHWVDNNLGAEFGDRQKYPHNYPDSHPQSQSNPQESWCYPVAALGAYREWLQDVYLENGKFAKYLTGKVKKGELAPSVANLAIETLTPTQIEGPKKAT